jgi:hypothetical protein
VDRKIVEMSTCRVENNRAEIADKMGSKKAEIAGRGHGNRAEIVFVNRADIAYDV